MTSKTLVDGPWHVRFPLHHAAREGIIEKVKSYVEEKNFTPDDADGEFLKVSTLSCFDGNPCHHMVLF
jgi:hypothetical protein